ncbi:MAG: GtrA family protein [Prevotellaceae bacterium]|jgi:putative flippase GtrA|nr:GtrA family protein [Prevotellaceae bacterium]
MAHRIDREAKPVKPAKNRKREVWLFLKAQCSAELATVADFLTTILLAKGVGLFYLYATFIGTVVGGVLNCCVNYAWVFKGSGSKPRYIAGRYVVVWGGSILLNTWGTFFLTEWITDMRWIAEALKGYVDDLFILSKIIVAVLVACCWNYPMQRHFVFRKHMR